MDSEMDSEVDSKMDSEMDSGGRKYLQSLETSYPK